MNFVSLQLRYFPLPSSREGGHQSPAERISALEANWAHTTGLEFKHDRSTPASAHARCLTEHSKAPHNILWMHRAGSLPACSCAHNCKQPTEFAQRSRRTTHVAPFDSNTMSMSIVHAKQCGCVQIKIKHARTKNLKALRKVESNACGAASRIRPGAGDQAGAGTSARPLQPPRQTFCSPNKSRLLVDSVSAQAMGRCTFGPSAGLPHGAGSRSTRWLQAMQNERPPLHCILGQGDKTRELGLRVRFD